jgi:hypothetical protein
VGSPKNDIEEGGDEKNEKEGDGNAIANEDVIEYQLALDGGVNNTKYGHNVSILFCKCIINNKGCHRNESKGHPKHV